MAYRREIDGLRAIAVIPVILLHAGFETFSGGYVGVDVFFVISGYLITSLLIAEAEHGGISLIRFYERRARRILPALFVLTACVIPMAWVSMSPGQFKDFGQSILAIGTFTSNIWFWMESGYFAPAAREIPMLHTWSLAVEEQYYLLFPFVLTALWPLGRKRAAAVLAAAALASLALSEWGWRQAPSANYYLFPFRAWELLAGSLCAFVLSSRPLTANGALAALGLGLVIVPVFLFDDATPFPSLYALAPVAGTALIILYAAPGTWAARALSTAPLVGIGLVSYSAYLWHYPLFAFANIRNLDSLGGDGYAMLSALTFLIAYLSWRFVEQPFRRQSASSGISRNTTLAISGGLAACFIAFGIATHMHNGFEFRYPTQYLQRISEILSLQAERQAAIRAGRCYFNEEGKYATLSDFTEHWSCLGDDEPHLRALHVAVYGDSHSADKAMALRRNGVDVLQVSGAGCPLVPADVAPPYCKALLNLFHEQAYAHGIKTVLLSAYMDDHELTADHLRQVLSYWSPRYERVVLFSPMPEYFKFDWRYITYGPDHARSTPQDDTRSRRFFGLLAQLDVPENVQAIDTPAVLCPAPGPCPPVRAGKAIVVDSAHLSVHGADGFGANLLAHLPSVVAANAQDGAEARGVTPRDSTRPGSTPRSQ